MGTGITLSVATYTINDGNTGGNYAITLVANNTGVIVTPAIATFDGKDATTEGSWINVYGSQGYNVINATSGVNYPSYATVTPAATRPTPGRPAPPTLPALQITPSGTSRIAASGIRPPASRWT